MLAIAISTTPEHAAAIRLAPGSVTLVDEWAIVNTNTDSNFSYASFCFTSSPLLASGAISDTGESVQLLLARLVESAVDPKHLAVTIPHGDIWFQRRLDLHPVAT